MSDVIILIIDTIVAIVVSGQWSVIAGRQLKRRAVVPDDCIILECDDLTLHVIST